MNKKWFNFNVNGDVKVVMSDFIKDKFCEFYQCKTCPIPIDKDNYATFPLWEFMMIYGRKMTFGGICPFNPNLRIEIDTDDFIQEGKEDAKDKGEE